MRLSFLVVIVLASSGLGGLLDGDGSLLSGYEVSADSEKLNDGVPDSERFLEDSSGDTDSEDEVKRINTKHNNQPSNLHNVDGASSRNKRQLPETKSPYKLLSTLLKSLLSTITKALNDIYKRIRNLRSDLNANARMQIKLTDKVNNVHAKINETRDLVQTNKEDNLNALNELEIKTNKKIADLQQKLENKITLIVEEANRKIDNLEVQVGKHDITFAQIKAEFALGEYHINQTISNNVSPQEGAVRIQEGNPRGRVQMQYMGAWTFICDSKWSLSNAHVVCNQLGFNTGPEPRRYIAAVVETVTTVTLDNVMCHGDEAVLGDCPKTGHNLHKCTRHRVAYVDCDPGVNGTAPPTVPPMKTPAVIYQKDNTRLNGGGNGTVGRLEVYIANKWGTVCGTFFGDKHAKVVCRSLGLPTGNATSSRENDYGFATDVPKDRKVVLDGVVCTGEEDNIFQCPTNTLGTKCDKSYNVGIKCE